MKKSKLMMEELAKVEEALAEVEVKKSQYLHQKIKLQAKLRRLKKKEWKKRGIIIPQKKAAGSGWIFLGLEITAHLDEDEGDVSLTIQKSQNTLGFIYIDEAEAVMDDPSSKPATYLKLLVRMEEVLREKGEEEALLLKDQIQLLAGPGKSRKP